MRRVKATKKELFKVYSVALRYGVLCNAFTLGMVVCPVYAEGDKPTVDIVSIIDWYSPSGMTGFTTLNGNYEFGVSGGVYRLITGTAMRNVINGNIILNLNNVSQKMEDPSNIDETGVYGSLFVASDYTGVPFIDQATGPNASLQQKILGTTTITITNSEIAGNVVGHNFFQDNVQELTDSGAVGKTTITLNNTSVERGLYGVNFGANPIFSGVAFGDIELNINNSFVRDEVVAAGSNASVGNVIINVRGNSVIGYTDDSAETAYLDQGGGIVAGGNSSDAKITSTLVNLDTNGIDNTINIGGDVYVGGRYRDGEDSGGVTGNATINMRGGGIINIGRNIHAYNVDGTSSLNINNVKADIDGNIIGFDVVNIGAGAVLGAHKLTLGQDSIVNVVLQDEDNYGVLLLDNLDANNAKLNLIVGGPGDYNFMSATNIITNFDYSLLNANPLFELKQHGGVITASEKSTETIAADIGASPEVANAMVAVARSNHTEAQRIKTEIQRLIGAGQGEYVKQEMVKLNPSQSPVETSVTLGLRDQVMYAVGERMSLALSGRNGGDVHADFGVWGKGLYNQTNHKDSLSSHTWGTSVGFDTDLNHNVILGLGYSYGQTDVNLNTSNIDIDSNTIFVYGQYGNSDWFINGSIAYIMSKYQTNKNVFGVDYNTVYHVNSLSEQVMSGYRFTNGITPTLGLRYLNVHTDSYFNGLTTVSDVDSTYLTGVAGIDYKRTWIAPYTSVFWNPEVRAALAYDMVTDPGMAIVMMPGAAAYTVDSDNLSRIGGEFGIGLSAEYYYLTVALNYDLNIRHDFTSQTGSLKVKYKF